jgi:hypothetical protein
VFHKSDALKIRRTIFNNVPFTSCLFLHKQMQLELPPNHVTQSKEKQMVWASFLANIVPSINSEHLSFNMSQLEAKFNLNFFYSKTAAEMTTYVFRRYFNSDPIDEIGMGTKNAYHIRAYVRGCISSIEQDRMNLMVQSDLSTVWYWLMFKCTTRHICQYNSLGTRNKSEYTRM